MAFEETGHCSKKGGGGGRRKEKSRKDCLACVSTLVEYRDERRKGRMEERVDDKVMSNRAREKYE